MLYLEIDVAAVIHNISLIRRSVDAEICAVIKANCYGLGIDLASYIEPYVDSFSVASVLEAKEARAIGLTKKIYILGAIDEENFEPLDGVVFTVTSHRDVDFLLNKNRSFKVAVKINTGMNRLGASPSEFDSIYRRIISSNALELDSVYTHFYNIDDGSYEKQFQLFKSLVKGLDIKKHCCASSCLKLDKKYHLDMVRCGLAIYGYGNPRLLPSLKVYSTIAQINEVKAGDYVGYGSCKLGSFSEIAVLRAGYADGYRRVHSQQFASLNRTLIPLVGQVSMDMITVDVTGRNAAPQDKIYLIDDVATIEFLAKANNTVIYEILTGLSGSRIKRIYV